jgi:hypothetical protein
MYRLLNQELTLLMFDYFTQSCKEAKTTKSVMLSDSETSHHSWRSQTGDPSLTLPVYASLRDRQDDATKMCGAGKAERAERSGLPRFFFGYFYVLFIIVFLPHRMPNIIMVKLNLYGVAFLL